ncbi:MAG: hypothetical protein PVF27_08210 [Gemmatimonadales bacterium]|jgi:hypothetical protein
MPRWAKWVGQGLLVAGVGAFVARAVVRRWDEFRSLDVELHLSALPLMLALLVVWATYGLLIEAWRRVLRGWDQQLPFGRAVRVWTLSNLGRYLPGKVWSVAGLAVLAQRAGVSGWAAAASAIAMQALALGTGAAVVAATVPGTVGPAQLAVAAVVAAAVIAVLGADRLMGRAIRALRPDAAMGALPRGTALVGAVVTALGWIGYGLAFWLVARGILPASQLDLRTAVGVFAGGYLVGLLAVFAPGGVGVRDLVFVAMLSGPVGAGGAVAVAVASRLLLTVTEVGAAAAGLMVGPRREEHVRD